MRSRINRIPSNRIAVFAAFVFAASSPAVADGWELLTTDIAVPGTREIESGDPEKAIELSRAYAITARGADKSAALNNLCVAYLMVGEIEQSREYCEEADDPFAEKTVALNNRGVFYAITGEHRKAAYDFEAAVRSGCMGECSEPASSPSDLPRPVARRNEQRITKILAAIEHESRAEEQVVSADR